MGKTIRMKSVKFIKKKPYFSAVEGVAPAYAISSPDPFWFLLGYTEKNRQLLENMNYGKCSKISNTFLFPFSNKMLVIRAGNHKILVIIANRNSASPEAVGSGSATITHIYLEALVEVVCSKELSHWDGSFEYQQNMLWLRNMKNNF